jgi:hypothetical protein
LTNKISHAIVFTTPTNTTKGNTVATNKNKEMVEYIMDGSFTEADRKDALIYALLYIGDELAKSNTQGE